MDGDRRTLLALESFARTTDRRAFLRKAFRTGLATLAATAFGSIATAQKVYADATCSCNPPNGLYCSGCPSGTGGGCPSTCTVCVFADCNGQNGCIYTAGHWSSCGCGACGAGCRVCYDCKCPGCSNTCGCRSDCNCCNCCSPQDIAAEVRRVAAEEAAQQRSAGSR